MGEINCAIDRFLKNYDNWLNNEIFSFNIYFFININFIF